MKFSGREDIETAASGVFSQLTDFDTHERAAMRRGIQVDRIDGLSDIEAGMTWSTRVRFRGRSRHMTIELIEIIPDETLVYRLDGSGLAGEFSLDLLALSPRKTRVAVALEFKPKNMTGRLLMQSLRIVKPNLNRRFQTRIKETARVLGGLPPGIS